MSVTNTKFLQVMTCFLYVMTCGVFVAASASANEANKPATVTTQTQGNQGNKAMSGQGDQENKAVAPDNSGVNERDRNTSERTADQAKSTLTDREIMQKIRKSVVDDKSLSTYAHNVKIISEQGKVTLKGPVRSEEERTNIKNKAMEVAGQDNVKDEMSIAKDRK